jgi:hypothetical protein
MFVVIVVCIFQEFFDAVTLQEWCSKTITTSTRLTITTQSIVRAHSKPCLGRPDDLLMCIGGFL